MIPSGIQTKKYSSIPPGSCLGIPTRIYPTILLIIYPAIFPGIPRVVPQVIPPEIYIGIVLQGFF